METADMFKLMLHSSINGITAGTQFNGLIRHSFLVQRGALDRENEDHHPEGPGTQVMGRICVLPF